MIKSIGLLILFFSTNTYALCFNKDHTRKGLSTICFYECTGGDVSIVLEGYVICPITITDRNARFDNNLDDLFSK